VLKEVGVKWREITERWTWGKGSEAIAWGPWPPKSNSITKRKTLPEAVANATTFMSTAKNILCRRAMSNWVEFEELWKPSQTNTACFLLFWSYHNWMEWGNLSYTIKSGLSIMLFKKNFFFYYTVVWTQGFATCWAGALLLEPYVQPFFLWLLR
jgi:hypothetical protein